MAVMAVIGVVYGIDYHLLDSLYPLDPLRPLSAPVDPNLGGSTLGSVESC